MCESVFSSYLIKTSCAGTHNHFIIQPFIKLLTTSLAIFGFLFLSRAICRHGATVLKCCLNYTILNNKVENNSYFLVKLFTLIELVC